MTGYKIMANAKDNGDKSILTGCPPRQIYIARDRGETTTKFRFFIKIAADIGQSSRGTPGTGGNSHVPPHIAEMALLFPICM